MQVKIYETADDDKLRFAVIAARHNGDYVFCKHKERETLELPGGRREQGEDIIETARRELREETGALEFTINPVCAYSVTGSNRVNEDGSECFGMLFCAEITRFGEINSEIERTEPCSVLPENLTYPEIQPILFEEVCRRGASA